MRLTKLMDGDRLKRWRVHWERFLRVRVRVCCCEAAALCWIVVEGWALAAGLRGEPRGGSSKGGSRETP